MGYAYYDTPLGPAGYSVEDICHEADCAEEIDRGLAYLCGNAPGYEYDQFGCGHWYCGEHLFMAPRSIQILGSGLCSRCTATWEAENPELVAEEEAKFQRAELRATGTLS